LVKNVYKEVFYLLGAKPDNWY